VKLRSTGVSSPSEAGAEEGERRDQARPTRPWALALIWAGSGQEERKREGREQLGRSRSWATSIAGSGREREVKEVLSFSNF
jgi:hypothetical protein